MCLLKLYRVRNRPVGAAAAAAPLCSAQCFNVKASRALQAKRRASCPAATAQQEEAQKADKKRHTNNLICNHNGRIHLDGPWHRRALKACRDAAAAAVAAVQQEAPPPCRLTSVHESAVQERPCLYEAAATVATAEAATAAAAVMLPDAPVAAWEDVKNQEKAAVHHTGLVHSAAAPAAAVCNETYTAVEGAAAAGSEQQQQLAQPRLLLQDIGAEQHAGEAAADEQTSGGPYYAGRPVHALEKGSSDCSSKKAQ